MFISDRVLYSRIVELVNQFDLEARLMWFGWIVKGFSDGWGVAGFRCC